MWNKALNQAGVENSSAWRKAENVYYPLAIWASSPSSSKADTVPKDLGCNKGISNKALSSSNDPPKDAEQVRAAEKENNTTKGVVLEATKPPIAPKDFSKDKGAFQSLEIVLAILPTHTKEDPKGKGPTTTATTTAKSIKAPAKDNPPLKIK